MSSLQQINTPPKIPYTIFFLRMRNKIKNQASWVPKIVFPFLGPVMHLFATQTKDINATIIIVRKYGIVCTIFIVKFNESVTLYDHMIIRNVRRYHFAVPFYHMSCDSPSVDYRSLYSSL